MAHNGMSGVQVYAHLYYQIFYMPPLNKEERLTEIDQHKVKRDKWCEWRHTCLQALILPVLKRMNIKEIILNIIFIFSSAI